MCHIGDISQVCEMSPRAHIEPRLSTVQLFNLPFQMCTAGIPCPAELLVYVGDHKSSRYRGFDSMRNLDDISQDNNESFSVKSLFFLMMNHAALETNLLRGQLFLICNNS